MNRFIVAIFLCLSTGCITAPRAEVPENGPIAGQSLYDQPWTWRTDKEHPLLLSQFRGRPVVIAMFFTTCAGTCGVTVHHLEQIHASLTAEDRKLVQFVLVTFDSQNDTPRQLAKYRADRQLPPEWVLLHGSAADTRELADSLQVQFASDSARHILHGAQITVVDRQGIIVRRVSGVNADPNLVLETIQTELAGESLLPDPIETAKTTGQVDSTAKCRCCCSK